MTTALPALPKLKPNPHWTKLPLFNRKNWSRVRFGDVVENVNERVEPSTVAEVDGICSAHAMVAGAKPKVVLPVPPMKEQREIVHKVSEHQSAGSQLAAHVERTRALLSTLVNTFN